MMLRLTSYFSAAHAKTGFWNCTHPNPSVASRHRYRAVEKSGHALLGKIG